MKARTRAGVVSVVVVNYRGADDTIACLRAFQNTSTGRPITSSSSWSTTPRATAASTSCSPRAARRRSSSRRSTPASPAAATSASRSDGRVRRVPQQRRPAPIRVGRARPSSCSEHDRAIGASPARCSTGTATTIDFVDGGARLVRHGLQAPRRATRRRPTETPNATCCSAPARRCSCARDVSPTTSAASTSATSCSSRTSTSGGGCGCSGTGSATCPTSIAFHRHHASMTKLGTWREHYLLERNALLTHLQELRRREPRARCCPAPWRSRAAGRRAAASATRRSSTCSAAGRRRKTPTIARSPRRRWRRPTRSTRSSSTCRRSTATRRELQSPRVRPDAEIAPAVPARRCAPTSPDPALPRRLTTPSSTPSASTSASPTRGDRRRHRRHAQREDGRPGDPGLAHRRALSASTTSSWSPPSDCTLDAPGLRASRQRRRPDLQELEAWCDVIVFQGYLMQQHPVAPHQQQGHRRRHLRPVPPRAARAGPGPRPDGATARRTVGDRDVLNEQLQRGRLLPLRVDEAARLLARPARGARPRQPPDLRRATRRLESLHRRRAVRRDRRPAGHARGRRIKGVVPGHRAGRQGDPLGRRHLQLVRPAHADPRRRPARPSVGRACGCSSWASSTRTPTCPRCAWRSKPARWPTELGLLDTHVFFNDGWVAVRRPAELPARRRRRRQHPPRPRRDRVLVPHPHPRLPVGRAAHRGHRGRHLRPSWSTSRGLGRRGPAG